MKMARDRSMSSAATVYEVLGVNPPPPAAVAWNKLFSFQRHQVCMNLSLPTCYQTTEWRSLPKHVKERLTDAHYRRT